MFTNKFTLFPPSSFSNRTGFVHFDSNVDHFCLWDEKYEETPRRYSRTLERMKELELIDRCQLIEVIEIQR